MPELPEVESLCRQLNGAFCGQSIKTVQLITKSLDLRKPLIGLAGYRLVAISRHGKFVTMKLSDETRLLIHLGMSGRLVMRPPSQKHDHFALHFGQGLCLTFNDFRRFGRVWRIPEVQLWRQLPLSGLGPDALSGSFKARAFSISSRRSLKSILLDQKIVAGLGNIYSSESLYRAGILPTRAIDSLSEYERNKLVTAIKGTLRSAIRRGGATLDDYRGTEGQSGDYERYFSVYSKEGEPCPKCVCATGVRRIVQQGRSTYYCPTLQR